MRIIKHTESIRDRVLKEQREALIEKQEAQIQYLAMMMGEDLNMIDEGDVTNVPEN